MLYNFGTYSEIINIFKDLNYYMPQIIERVLGATIKRYLFRGRVVIIYGARRVGKTTLVKGLLEEFQESKQTRYINCDDLANQRVLDAIRSSSASGGAWVDIEP